MDTPVATPTPISAAAPAEARPGRPPRRPHRVRNGVLGAVLVLIAGLAACEIAGWPFLAKPVERALTRTLQRDFVLGRNAEGKGATVHFLGGLSIHVPMLQIAAPAWSKQPFFVHAEDADLKMSYAALWRARQGQALELERLRARQLIVHAERLADERASWQFGDPNQKTPDDGGKPMQLPVIEELTVNDGELSYNDAPLRANLTAKLQLAEGTLIDNTVSGLIGAANGTYGDAKVSARLTAAGAMPLLAPAHNAPPTPVELELTAGEGSVFFKGTVTDVLHLSGLAGTYKVSGPSLAAVGDPLGVTLPTTGAFSIAGKISKQGQLWNFVADKATVGSSQLRAALTYDMRPKVPLLAGRVDGPRLLLADLAPTIGGEPDAPAAPSKGQKTAARPAGKPAEKPAPNGKVLPDREFDLPSLRAMNANVLMAFDRMELGSLFAQPLQPLKAHLILQDGKLALNELEARTADGTLTGSVALDGTGKAALWNTDLRWSDVQLDRWLKQERSGNQPPYISGRLQGRAVLKGEGRSTAQILGSLNGQLMTQLQDGRISHLAVEAAGLDIAQALGVFVKGDEALPVQCAMADLQANKGVLQPRAMVVDTGDSNLWVTGKLSLLDETMDLRAVVNPKDFSPLALRTPVHVQGTFSDPDVSLEKAPLGRKIAAATLLGLINPIAAIIPLVDLGKDDPQAKGCPELVQRARNASQSAQSPPAAAASPRR